MLQEVEYTVSGTYVLGIGGFKQRHQNAVEELYKSVNLNERQQIVNITTHSYLNIIVCGLVVHKKTTAKGTLIELLDGNKPVQSVESQQGTMPWVTANPEPQTAAPTLSHASAVRSNNFALISINPQWKSFTKKIAQKYNESQTFKPIYDFNEDGKLSVEELEYINYVVGHPGRASNKDVLFDMAHKDYENTVERLKNKNN